MLSPVQLFAIPWTVDHQAPLSMGFQSRILKWVAISFSRGSPRPRDGTCSFLHWQLDSLSLSHQGSPQFCIAFKYLMSELSPTAAATAAKSLQSCPTLCDLIDGRPRGSTVPGFSRQEHWSGLPLPSLMHESEK